MWSHADKRNVAIRLMPTPNIPSFHQVTLLYFKPCKDNYFRVPSVLSNSFLLITRGVAGGACCVSGTSHDLHPSCILYMQFPASDETQNFTPHLLFFPTIESMLHCDKAFLRA